MRPIIIVIVVGCVLWIAVQMTVKNIRRSYLEKKYPDDELRRRIQGQMIWQGQTSEQLTDALGKPEDVDVKVMKTKRKETWKYRPTGKERYGLIVTIEDDVVVGWDKKD